MKSLFKYLYNQTKVGKIIIQTGISIYQFYWHRIVPEKYSVKRRFRNDMGYDLDLHNPQSLNEKINWLKLYFRTPLLTQCADKYAVRDYIRLKIGEKYLVPLLYMTKEPKDINPENLPNEPFIIKTNHDSSGGIVVKDKKSTDWRNIQLILKKRLSKNYYFKSKEWQYKDIVPCIIVEELLKGENGGFPLDYKLHCFNGKVNMIQVDVGRFSENHYRNWYNANWLREPYSWFKRDEIGKISTLNTQEVERPKNLDKMIELSEIIAKDFVYVRVDWYDIEGKLFFGEITFHHDGGTKPIYPKEWDLKLGSKLVLPIIDSN